MTNCPKNFEELSTLETGLSDFHKMVVTVFKSKAPNVTPKVVSTKVKLEVSNKLSRQDPSTMDYKNFKGTIIDSPNINAPLKRKYLRANHSNFITKELSNAIMQSSKLLNFCLEERWIRTDLGIRSKKYLCLST